MEKQRCVPCIVELHDTVAVNNVQILSVTLETQLCVAVHCCYLLSPWRRILLEKLTGFKLVKEFPAFYGTRRFITAFTSARHVSLS